MNAMHKKITAYLLGMLAFLQGSAQELYVFSEPASNMPAGSIAARMGNKAMRMEKTTTWRYRAEPEIRIGVSKKWMLEMKGYLGTAYTGNFRAEGASLYTKYRFFSQDEVHQHLRMAAFAKISLSSNPAQYLSTYKYYIDHNNGEPPMEHTGKKLHSSGDYDLDGNHSGAEIGMILTQLKNKTAVSATASFTRLVDNINSRRPDGQPVWGFNYSLSAGRLMLPVEYRSYRQVNLNLYAEWLGTVLGDGKGAYADVAPAVQLIFNSVAKLDIGARFAVGNSVVRMSTRTYLVRLEYNFLNALNRNKK
jgi:hypothetical protein